MRIGQGRIRILRPVFFATNRDTILPRSAAVAEALRAEPALRAVSIEGHTDEVADDAFNLALSQRRADRVRDALVRLGIAASRLQTVGYSETRPVMEGHSRQARAANRRVDSASPMIVADEPGGARWSARLALVLALVAGCGTAPLLGALSAGRDASGANDAGDVTTTAGGWR